MARLGLLAAGCEDGTVRIFFVPEFGALPTEVSSQHRVFKCDKSIVTLRRPDDGVDGEGHLSPCVKVNILIFNLVKTAVNLCQISVNSNHLNTRHGQHFLRCPWYLITVVIQTQ